MTSFKAEPNAIADNSISCDTQCARYIPTLLIMPLLGAFAFLCISRNVSVPWASKLIDVFGPYLTWAVTFLLPRSYVELPAIKDAFGGTCYEFSIISMSAFSVIGWWVVLRVSFKSSRASPAFATSKSKSLIAGVIIVLVFLIFRQPYFGRMTSLLGDNLDSSGFFLLRESCFISSGFFYLSLIASNLFSFRLPPL